MKAMNEEETNYMKYRGKCKEFCEALIKEDPTLTIARGYYFDFEWGEQSHWWCKKPDGTIVDPTKDQFPSKGMGTYEEFKGTFKCSECRKEIAEQHGIIMGNYIVCSDACALRLVGL